MGVINQLIVEHGNPVIAAHFGYIIH